MPGIVWQRRTAATSSTICPKSRRDAAPTATFLLLMISCDIANQTDIVVDPNGIPLGSVARRKISRITCFWIAALRSSAMNIHPGDIHVSHGPAKGDIDPRGAGSRCPVGVGGTAPVTGIISIPA